MNIKIGNFLVKQCPADCNKFDLYILKDRLDKKTGETKQVEENEAYGCTFESVVHRILMKNIFDNTTTQSIKEFVDIYKSEVKKIQELLK